MDFYLNKSEWGGVAHRGEHSNTEDFRRQFNIKKFGDGFKLFINESSNLYFNESKHESGVALEGMHSNTTDERRKLNLKIIAQSKVRDPINEPPAWDCPIRHNDAWADPRLNSGTGFHCTNDHSVPFHIIADFGAFVKIREVLWKKRGDNQHIDRVIHQFKLEYWHKNAWVEHGVFDT